jgi:hypothetical protein
MKNFYYAVDMINETGKYYPCVISIKENANLIAHIPEKAKVFRPCATRKEAIQIIKHWRLTHQVKGELDELLTDLF